MIGFRHISMLKQKLRDQQKKVLSKREQKIKADIEWEEDKAKYRKLQMEKQKLRESYRPKATASKVGGNVLQRVIVGHQDRKESNPFSSGSKKKMFGESKNPFYD